MSLFFNVKHLAFEGDFLEQTAIHNILTPCYRNPCQRLQSLWYRQYAIGHTMLDAWFIYQQCSFFCQVTGNLNCSIVYDQDTCRTYTWLKELSASVDAFAENVSVTTSFPGFSHGPGCMSEYTTQGPFGNNELCCFDIGPWVREPKSNLCQHKVSKWHIWILKPITKPFGYPQVKKWKRKKNDTKRRKKENLNLLCVPVLVPGWFDNKQTF